MLHILIAITKSSGLNLFISSVEGVGPWNVHPIKMFGPNITISCPACLSNMYLHTSAHPVCTDMIRHQRVPGWMNSSIIVIICALHCNVFSEVNETWGNLTALHSTLHKRRLSSCRRLVSALTECVRVFWGRCSFAEWLWMEGGDLAFKANFLSLAFPKSPTLPLKIKSYVIVIIYKNTITCSTSKTNFLFHCHHKSPLLFPFIIHSCS